MRIVFALMSALFITGSFTVQAADPAPYIKACFDCHGPNGVSADKDMPTIAGLSQAYLEDSMFGYVDQTRPAQSVAYLSGDTKRPPTDMIKIAKGLSEAQITELADYFSKQKFVAAKQTFDPQQAKKGQQVHKMQCEICHEAAGSVPADDAGILSGQWRGYLKQTFAEYRNKTREGNKRMIATMVKLSDQDIEALLHYYASAKTE